MSEENWRWYASADGENYTIGPCRTKEQAIDEAADEELGYDFDDKTQHTMRFHIVEAKKAAGDLSKYFDASIWLDDLENSDLFYGYSEWNDPLEGIDTISLEVAIRAAIAEWQKEKGFVLRLWRFAECRNGEWIEKSYPLVESAQ